MNMMNKPKPLTAAQRKALRERVAKLGPWFRQLVIEQGFGDEIADVLPKSWPKDHLGASRPARRAERAVRFS